MKIRLLAIFITVLSIFFCIPSSFAQISAYVKLDKTTLSLNDTLEMQIIVNGNVSSMPNLSFDNSAFGLVSTSSSYNQSIINGNSSSESVYSYILVPKKVGKFNIGKADILVNGQKITTKPTPVTVFKGSGTSSSSNSHFSSSSNSVASGASYSIPTVTVKSNYFADPNNSDILFNAKVNKTTSFLNEQIIYTTTVYLRQSLDQINITPSLNDFIYEQQDQKSPYLVTINGLEYKAYDFSYILFPTKTGHIVIPPTVLTGQLIDYNDPLSYMFSGSSNSKNITLKTPPISIYVKSLPNPPSDFSNAVGRFSINSKINKSALKTGDTLTLTVVLSGSGNIKSLNNPKLSLSDDFMKNFKIYPSSSQQDISYKNNNIYAQKIFKYDLVPLKQGKYTIPSIAYTYFDPSSSQYKVIKTGEEKIKVFPGTIDSTTLQSRNTDSSQQIQSLQDILPVHKGNNLLNQPIKAYYYLIFLSLILLPYALLLILLHRINKKYNEMENTPYFRQKMAYKFAKRSMYELKKLKPFSINMLPAIMKVFKRYLSDKLDISAFGLTANEIKTILQNKSVSEDVIADLDVILYFCEHMAYSNDISNPMSIEELFEKSFRILPKLDKELKKCI